MSADIILLLDADAAPTYYMPLHHLREYSQERVPTFLSSPFRGPIHIRESAQKYTSKLVYKEVRA